MPSGRSTRPQAVLGLVFDASVAGLSRSSIATCCSTSSDEALFQPFFIGRGFEAVLRQGGPWDQHERIVTGALQPA